MRHVGRQDAPDDKPSMVEELLEKEGYAEATVYKIESPGDAGLSEAEVLFVTAAKRPMRAYLALHGENIAIRFEEGWDLA